MRTWNLNLFCWLKARLLCRINRLSHFIWSTIFLTSTFTCNLLCAGNGKSVIVISQELLNISIYNAHLPHDTLVYPPKIYLPTLIIITVGPLPSHREWNVLPPQPSTDARQQRFQRDLTIFVTGASQFVNEIKWSVLLYLKMTEFSKPKGKNKTIFHYMRYKVFEISQKLNLFPVQWGISKEINHIAECKTLTCMFISQIF